MRRSGYGIFCSLAHAKSRCERAIACSDVRILPLGTPGIACTAVLAAWHESASGKHACHPKNCHKENGQRGRWLGHRFVHVHTVAIKVSSSGDMMLNASGASGSDLPRGGRNQLQLVIPGGCRRCIDVQLPSRRRVRGISGHARAPLRELDGAHESAASPSQPQQRRRIGVELQPS